MATIRRGESLRFRYSEGVGFLGGEKVKFSIHPSNLIHISFSWMDRGFTMRCYGPSCSGGFGFVHAGICGCLCEFHIAWLRLTMLSLICIGTKLNVSGIEYSRIVWWLVTHIFTARLMHRPNWRFPLVIFMLVVIVSISQIDVLGFLSRLLTSIIESLLLNRPIY